MIYIYIIPEGCPHPKDGTLVQGNNLNCQQQSPSKINQEKNGGIIKVTEWPREEVYPLIKEKVPSQIGKFLKRGNLKCLPPPKPRNYQNQWIPKKENLN